MEPKPGPFPDDPVDDDLLNDALDNDPDPESWEEDAALDRWLGDDN